MLGNNKPETYYAISTRYNFEYKKVIATICETDGANNFTFIASYENNIDPEIISTIKKAKGYGLSFDELSNIASTYRDTLSNAIKSILAENNIKPEDIDFICLDNLEIAENCRIDIATDIFKELDIPVIYDINQSENLDFLNILTKNKQDKTNLVINLNGTFDIFKLGENSAYLIEQTIGYSCMRYLSIYLNQEHDTLSHLIAQGNINQELANKLMEIDNLESLQKELINLIILSPINDQDKLATAYYIIKSLLLKCLSQFDKSNKIMLIGNTTLVEDLNQALKSSFSDIEFVKNQSQRQDTFLNEHMTYLAAKKYVLENYNNGVKLS